MRDQIALSNDEFQIPIRVTLKPIVSYLVIEVHHIGLDRRILVRSLVEWGTHLKYKKEISQSDDKNSLLP